MNKLKRFKETLQGGCITLIRRAETAIKEEGTFDTNELADENGQVTVEYN